MLMQFLTKPRLGMNLYYVFNIYLIVYRYAFPVNRYGIDTNNIIESINSVWGNIRKLPPLQMMDAIYKYLIKLVYDRSQQKQQTEYLANVLLARFNDRLKQSRRYQVFGLGNGKYQVEILDSSRKYIVDLNEQYCDYGNFTEY